MIRQTSIESYAALKNSKALGEKQWHVYEMLYNDGPLTSNETAEKLRIAGIVRNKPSVTPRFAELSDMKLITAVGTRRCAVSGRNNIIWDVTNASVPAPRVRKPSRKQLLERITELEAELKRFSSVACYEPMTLK